MASNKNRVVEEDIAVIVGAALPWQALSGATVLVTGAAGFLPAYMIETLLFLNQSTLTKPARIIALVRDLARARERFASHIYRPDLEMIEQDVSDPLIFRDHLDYVIHAASPARPLQYLADPVGTLCANVLGTHRLLSAPQSRILRSFLFFSSGAVYGDITNKSLPVAEHHMGVLDPLSARACYEESKRMGETMCISWARQFGVPTRIVRPWHTYGPGMRLDDGRVFADFVRDILRGGPIYVEGDGQASRSFCYLGDATVGFFTVLLKGGHGEAYNVANPAGECSISELADRLAILYRSEGMTVRHQRSSYVDLEPAAAARVLPNVTKLENLGWRPTLSIEEGFARTVDSYRE